MLPKCLNLIGNLVLLFLIGSLLTACVSAGKYKTMEYEKGIAIAEKLNSEQKIADLEAQAKRLRQDTLGCGEDLRQINAQYDDLLRTSSLTGKQLAQQLQDNRQELEAKQEELQDKEAELQEREKLVKELQAVIERKEATQRALMSSLEGALVGFSAEDLVIERRGGKVYVSLSDKLLFKPGDIKVDVFGKSALAKVANVLNRNPNIDITIEGHTDNVPIRTAVYKDNWDLSVYRATSIVRILTEEYGVSPKRIIASGRGEYYPVDLNETTEGKARNRRTEIILMPKLDEIYSIIRTTERRVPVSMPTTPQKPQTAEPTEAEPKKEDTPDK